MARRVASASLIGLAVFVLAACGERPQIQPAAKEEGSRNRAPTSQAWTGTTGEFKTGEWTPGDRASWERQMRVRAQAQNEHVRISGGG
jgi:hypothetical protein